jgi:hypothetical protein
MTCDIPNAFIQTDMPKPKPGEDRVVMKITGVLVDMLVQLDPDLYGPFVVFEKGRKVLYVVLLKALYGMLIAALLWYQKFQSDLIEIGFEFNPYDGCVANRMIRGLQQTITIHVDDAKISCCDAAANDELAEWLEQKYGQFGSVKVHRGTKHDYLGMILDYGTPGKLIVAMTYYVKNMLEEFPIKFKSTDKVATPAAENLFTVTPSKKLDDARREIFHTTVAKGLFLSKRGRPDIHPTIAALCTRVKDPTEADWSKLLRLMKFLNGTVNDVLTLKADSINVIKWYVDAAFAVHPDFRSHSGAVMSFGSGAAQSGSRKQSKNGTRRVAPMPSSWVPMTS